MPLVLSARASRVRGCIGSARLTTPAAYFKIDMKLRTLLKLTDIFNRVHYRYLLKIKSELQVSLLFHWTLAKLFRFDKIT